MFCSQTYRYILVYVVNCSRFGAFFEFSHSSDARIQYINVSVYTLDAAYTHDHLLRVFAAPQTHKKRKGLHLARIQEHERGQGGTKHGNTHII